MANGFPTTHLRKGIEQLITGKCTFETISLYLLERQLFNRINLNHSLTSLVLHMPHRMT